MGAAVERAVVGFTGFGAKWGTGQGVGFQGSCCGAASRFTGSRVLEQNGAPARGSVSQGSVNQGSASGARVGAKWSTGAVRLAHLLWVGREVWARVYGEWDLVSGVQGWGLQGVGFLPLPSTPPSPTPLDPHREPAVAVRHAPLPPSQRAHNLYFNIL